MKKYLSIFLILILSISVLSACKHKASTLEEMTQTDEEINTKINTMFEDSDMDATINVVDNTINISIAIEKELEGIEVTKENKKIVLQWTAIYSGQFDLSFGNTVKTIIVESFY